MSRTDGGSGARPQSQGTPRSRIGTTALARRYDLDLAGALPAMKGVLRGAGAAANVRSGVAFAHWQAVQARQPMVEALADLLRQFEDPQLCAVLADDGSVTDVRLLDWRGREREVVEVGR